MMRNPATRLVKWCAWATGLCDDTGSPSAPKIGAALVIAAALFVALKTLRFDTGTSFVLSIALAALFGRSVFLHALDRGTFGMSRSDSQANAVNTTLSGSTADLAAIIREWKAKPPALPNPYLDNEAGDAR